MAYSSLFVCLLITNLLTAIGLYMIVQWRHHLAMCTDPKVFIVDLACWALHVFIHSVVVKMVNFLIQLYMCTRILCFACIILRRPWASPIQTVWLCVNCVYMYVCPSAQYHCTVAAHNVLHCKVWNTCEAGGIVHASCTMQCTLGTHLKSANNRASLTVHKFPVWRSLRGIGNIGVNNAWLHVE